MTDDGGETDGAPTPPAPPVRRSEREGARLVVLTGQGQGRKYAVHDELQIGRSADCDVVLVDDPEVSRRHTRITRTGPRTYEVVDLGSRNGTWMNGIRAVDDRSHPLRFGDRVQVGRTAFELVPYDRVEELLRQRQRLETLGRLGAGISHDFNNLVGAIVASVGYLRGLGPEARAAEIDECLADVDLAARRAAQLARRLMAFVRTDEGGAPAAVDEALGEVTALARRTFERRVEVAIETTAGLCVTMPSPELHQVVMNLCLNARDAIVERGGHGRIALRAHPQAEDRVVLEVEDDGCGMSEDTLSHLFEPFFSTKGDDAGFGLGLSTVSELVRAHGGTVTASSRPGAGSTFTITLPAARAADGANETRAVPFDAPGSRVAAGVRILVVDDEVLVRRSLTRVLARAGFEIVQAGTGEAALGGLDDVDVVLLDLDLPGMGGEETLRRIRLHHAVPVICITGHLDPDRERVVRALGAADYLTKPFEPDRLVATVVAALRTEGWTEPDDPTQCAP